MNSYINLRNRKISPMFDSMTIMVEGNTVLDKKRSNQVVVSNTANLTFDGLVEVLLNALLSTPPDFDNNEVEVIIPDNKCILAFKLIHCDLYRYNRSDVLVMLAYCCFKLLTTVYTNPKVHEIVLKAFDEYIALYGGSRGSFSIVDRDVETIQVVKRRRRPKGYKGIVKALRPKLIQLVTESTIEDLDDYDEDEISYRSIIDRIVEEDCLVSDRTETNEYSSGTCTKDLFELLKAAGIAAMRDVLLEFSKEKNTR